MSGPVLYFSKLGSTSESWCYLEFKFCSENAPELKSKGFRNGTLFTKLRNSSDLHSKNKKKTVENSKHHIASYSCISNMYQWPWPWKLNLMNNCSF